MTNTTNITLSEGIIDILEKHDFALLSINEHSSGNEYGRGYYVELETFSPEGEDFICTIFFDGTEADFIKEFGIYAREFDADEHAEMWVESRGHRGVPESIRDLINDAEAIKGILENLADDLENEGEETENTYTKIYTIYEKRNDITFIMEATYSEAKDEEGNDILLSEEVVGFYWGFPDEDNTRTYNGRLKANY